MECCRVADLHCKQVINTKNGCQLGFVNDVEINTCDGKLVALIIWGKSRLWGRKDDDLRICWKDIEVIGDDTILVCGCECAPRQPRPSKGSIFDNVFR